jgi:hypothetical protein
MDGLNSGGVTGWGEQSVVHNAMDSTRLPATRIMIGLNWSTHEAADKGRKRQRFDTSLSLPAEGSNKRQSAHFIKVAHGPFAFPFLFLWMSLYC